MGCGGMGLDWTGLDGIGWDWTGRDLTRGYGTYWYGDGKRMARKVLEGSGMKRPGLRHISRRALAGAVSLVFLSAAVTGYGCGKGGVSLEYEPRGDVAVITVLRGGGLPFPGDDLAPLFLLHGDGTFLKLAETGKEGRGGVLLQGKLDEAAVGDLLHELADTGFFSLRDEYRDPDVSDATYRRIEVDLAETDKSVTVWTAEDVPAFDAAYELILGYPVGETSEYVPALGYLVVTREPRQEGKRYDTLDPAGEIYRLLPDPETLRHAADTGTAVEVEGTVLLALKKYEAEQGIRGLSVSQPDSILTVYPVYEPRMAKKR